MDKKISKQEDIELNSLHTAKKTMNKMKRQLAEGEKIFVNHISDKGLIYKIGRELIQLNNNNKKQ